MDVTAAADCRGVPELRRRRIDRGLQPALRLNQSLGGSQLVQRRCGNHGTSPGSKILGREIIPRRLPKIRIDIVRANVVNFPTVIDVVEQFLARKAGASLQQSRHAAIVNARGDALATFAPEADEDLVILDGDVSRLQGGQTVRLVISRVFGVADPHHGCIEQTDDRSEDALAREFLVC